MNSTTLKFSLGEILQFTTGMPFKPPLGFMPQPSVGFTSSSIFPIANTCANVIHLPTMHTSVDQFGCTSVLEFKILLDLAKFN